MTNLQKYTAHINNLPTPGGGGAHRAIYGAGCLGYKADIPVELVIEDVREKMPTGSRYVPDSEIQQGVEQAFLDMAGGLERLRKPIEPRIQHGIKEELISRGKGIKEADIIAKSPIPVGDPGVNQTITVLNTLYSDNDLLFIAKDDKALGIMNDTIRTKEEWVKLFRNSLSCIYPKIMVNPLTGNVGITKRGSPSLRSDSCIKSHRFLVAEFDNIPIEDQLAFWWAVPELPISALIHSGKKSIHAWIRVDCNDAEEWEKEVEEKLFPGFLTPLGLDPACRNESRLSRMAGHVRVDTGLMQRCIYLAPEGKAIHQ